MTDTRRYSQEYMDAALCIFHALLDATNARPAAQGSLREYLSNTAEGIGSLRELAITLCVDIEQAWASNQLNEEYGNPFDFEFVPDILELAVRTFGTLELNVMQWQALGGAVMLQGIKSNRESMMRAMEKDGTFDESANG